MIELLWKRTHEHTLPVPCKATAGAAGIDLPALERVTVWGWSQAWVRTGWCVAIPDGYVGLIRDRSGLAGRHISTRAGVIDCDYRGEVNVLLVNDGESPLILHPGHRIAQMLIVSVPAIQCTEAGELGETERGDKGWGSTGK